MAEAASVVGRPVEVARADITNSVIPSEAAMRRSRGIAVVLRRGPSRGRDDSIPRIAVARSE